MPEAYVRRIEADLGVAVRVHDAWKPSLAAKTVLTTLRGANGGVLFSAGSGKANLPELVREAEVIVVSGNPLTRRGPSIRGTMTVPWASIPTRGAGS